jgi:hypothetical protein
MRVAILKFGFVVCLQVALAVSAQSTTLTGYISVTDANTNAGLGFVGNTFNDLGEYGVTTIVANRLSVTFTPASEFSIAIANGPTNSFPYFGAIVGFSNSSSNLGPGNSNYAYLGGTVLTSLSSTPASGSNSFTAATGIDEAVESTVWSISGSNVLTAQWVNTDSTTASTNLLLPAGQDFVVLSGDPIAFGSIFGDDALLTFNFVPTDISDAPEPSSFALGLGAFAVALTRFCRMRLKRYLHTCKVQPVRLHSFIRSRENPVFESDLRDSFIS